MCELHVHLCIVAAGYHYFNIREFFRANGAVSTRATVYVNKYFWSPVSADDVTASHGLLRDAMHSDARLRLQVGVSFRQKCFAPYQSILTANYEGAGNLCHYRICACSFIKFECFSCSQGRLLGHLYCRLDPRCWHAVHGCYGTVISSVTICLGNRWFWHKCRPDTRTRFSKLCFFQLMANINTVLEASHNNTVSRIGACFVNFSVMFDEFALP